MMEKLFELINYAAAILEERNAGHTITIQELRSDVTKMAHITAPERRTLVRLIDAVEEITVGRIQDLALLDDEVAEIIYQKCSAMRKAQVK